MIHLFSHMIFAHDSFFFFFTWLIYFHVSFVHTVDLFFNWFLHNSFIYMWEFCTWLIYFHVIFPYVTLLISCWFLPPHNCLIFTCENKNHSFVFHTWFLHSFKWSFQLFHKKIPKFSIFFYTFKFTWFFCTLFI